MRSFEDKLVLPPEVEPLLEPDFLTQLLLPPLTDKSVASLSLSRLLSLEPRLPARWCSLTYRGELLTSITKQRRRSGVGVVWEELLKLICSTYSTIKGICSLKALKFKCFKYTEENTDGRFPLGHNYPSSY